MNIPQTGRQPIALSTEDIKKALRRPMPQDAADFFATDPNSEIRTLGRLALRRNDLNDLFALGDLCARRSINDEGRLMVFYVGKTLIAYRKALRTAQSEDDQQVARTAVDDYLRWVVETALRRVNRRNLSVALWAMSEDDDDERMEAREAESRQ